MKNKKKGENYKTQTGLWVTFWIMFFLWVWLVIGYISTPTDWSITIITDNNTKEIFYLLNESGVYK